MLINPLFMKRIENRLEEAGYRVINWGYPSRRATVEEHAENLGRVFDELGPGVRTHFVGFSIGALIIRRYLGSHPVKNAGRFVMIGPPNHGSEAADYLSKFSWFRLLYGKPLHQLRASIRDFYSQLPIPACEYGIIAGGRGNEKGYSDRLPGDDDGVVSVASAGLEGAKDFIVLPYRHTPLIFASKTAENVLSFIKTGQFIK